MSKKKKVETKYRPNPVKQRFVNDQIQYTKQIYQFVILIIKSQKVVRSYKYISLAEKKNSSIWSKIVICHFC